MFILFKSEPFAFFGGLTAQINRASGGSGAVYLYFAHDDIQYQVKALAELRKGSDYQVHIDIALLH